MIDGVHAIVYSRHAEQVRAFFRDVLGRDSVDAGAGWPIFSMPPAELAVHPADDDGMDGRHEIYLMCEDVAATVEELRRRGMETSPVTDQGWGLLTKIQLPGGGELPMYQPRHPRAPAG